VNIEQGQCLQSATIEQGVGDCPASGPLIQI
jgi:hypothetical protein